MTGPRFPGCDVLDKRDTPSWNEETRRVIDKRLSEIPSRRFFTPEEWAMLAAIADRIVPQPGPVKERVSIAPWIDRKLAETGFSVVAFDAGPFWRALEDFVSDEESQRKLYWTDKRVSGGDDPLELGRNNSGKGVGGSTVHFTMVSLRFRPEWFKSRSALGYGVDWPVSAAEMGRYYAEVEEALKVAGPVRHPWGPPRGRYSYRAHEVNAAGLVLARGAESSYRQHRNLRSGHHQPEDRQHRANGGKAEGVPCTEQAVILRRQRSLLPHCLPGLTGRSGISGGPTRLREPTTSSSCRTRCRTSPGQSRVLVKAERRR